jgi:adenosylcobinamide-phosphate synthase
MMARDCRRHASPNAGWPEAAMAGALGAALAGPISYDGVMRTSPGSAMARRRAWPICPAPWRSIAGPA